jgi:hypothetical protein
MGQSQIAASMASWRDWLMYRLWHPSAFRGLRVHDDGRCYSGDGWCALAAGTARCAAGGSSALLKIAEALAMTRFLMIVKGLVRLAVGGPNPSRS